jgi:hypothetical protein
VLAIGPSWPYPARCVDWRRETFNSTFEARGSRGHLPVDGMLPLISCRNGMKWHKLACRPWRQGESSRFRFRCQKGRVLHLAQTPPWFSTIKLFDFLRLSWWVGTNHVKTCGQELVACSPRPVQIGKLNSCTGSIPVFAKSSVDSLHWAFPAESDPNLEPADSTSQRSVDLDLGESVNLSLVLLEQRLYLY